MPIFTTDDGARIHYEEQGSGRPVVPIHGWDANHRFFHKQVPALAERYRVVTFDLRGHGESERSEKTEQGLTIQRCAKDVAGLIDALGLKDVTLVGWSMGSTIMLDYVRQQGCANLAGLCVLDMTPRLVAAPDWALGAGPSYDYEANFWFLTSIARDWPTVVEKFIPLMFSKSQPPRPEDLAWVKNQALDNTPHCMLNLWISMAATDHRDMLSSISVPTLLAFGGDGYFYGQKHGEYLKDHIPGSELVMFPDCGHALHLQDPDGVNRALLSFLDRL